MPSLQKMQQVIGKPMPHAGQLVRRVMGNQMINQAELSRRLQVSQTTLTRMLRQPTLHAALLWKLGLVLQYNFFRPWPWTFPLRRSRLPPHWNKRNNCSSKSQPCNNNWPKLNWKTVFIKKCWGD